MKSNLFKAFKPKLSESSQVGLRIGLARERHSIFPMNLDFIMMDLERPTHLSRHADFCTGDLTGRSLEFLSHSHLIDGKEYPEIHKLFERILRTKNEFGVYGRFSASEDNKSFEENPIECSKLAYGFIRYYEQFGDKRALEAAENIANFVLEHLDVNFWPLTENDPNHLENWIIITFARLYGLTGDERYYKTVEYMRDNIGGIMYTHSHGFLTTIRGLSIMAIITGDPSWAEKPEKYRRMIIDNCFEGSDGDIPEAFPVSERNEGCSIADWAWLNLYSGLIFDDDSAFEHAEHIMYNALFYNQFVTGGFGHKTIIPQGYGVGELQEAWWCCTQTGGMVMCEMANHAVILRDGKLKINFLIEGEYTAMTDKGEIKVKIHTTWPKKAEAVIEIENLPEGMEVVLRNPSFVKNIKLSTRKVGNETVLNWSGDIGYYLRPYKDKYSLMYGTVMLAPSTNTWGGEVVQINGETTVPEGYRSAQFPSVDAKILLPEKDENGFYKFSHNPIPAWTFFEEGESGRCNVGKTTVNVDLKFFDGSVHTARFYPLCMNTSTLCMYTTPIIFDI